jgi:[FeFe] hydrogenase H-cluster maturation GTPase HydF
MPRIDRLVIGIFGRINAGKSTLMNLITQQETSLVDPHPGTTSDVKSAVMEIHSLGPVRILDTAGLDEGSALGDKKRKKAISSLEECDLALLVIDPVQAFLSGQLHVEELVGNLARRHGKALAVVFNVHANARAALAPEGVTPAEAVEFARTALPDRASVPSIAIDLSDRSGVHAVVALAEKARPAEGAPPELLPFIRPREAVILSIPMDEETPSGRLLRPQEMAMEYLLRMNVPVGLYRTDLRLARSASSALSATERQRFLGFLESFRSGPGVQAVITDSQAMDLMKDWVPREIPLTTFSIMMINQTAGGDLALFAEGTRTLDSLSAGDGVLIVEACNHDRMAEDIGTVQIPGKLLRAIPGLKIDHSFGREFPRPEELKAYRLAVHCGGCMISHQSASARIRRLAEAGVPVSNYGLVLSWLEGPEVLARVLEPWTGGRGES